MAATKYLTFTVSAEDLDIFSAGSTKIGILFISPINDASYYVAIPKSVDGDVMPGGTITDFSGSVVTSVNISGNVITLKNFTSTNTNSGDLFVIDPGID